MVVLFVGCAVRTISSLAFRGARGRLLVSRLVLLAVDEHVSEGLADWASGRKSRLGKWGRGLYEGQRLTLVI